jgi:hypothetical protein
MIFLRSIQILIVLIFSTPTFGQNLKSLFGTRHTLSYVKNLPVKSKNNILVISSRFFQPLDNYTLKRGLHPRLNMFYFVVNFSGDTGSIKPFNNMEEALQYIPDDRDFLVFIDGHGKTFNQALERGFELNERYNSNVIIFDWPTDYFALRKTASNAGEVAINFVKAISEFSILHETYFADKSVSAAFHSMGNRILKELIDQQLLQYMPDNLFSNITLNAAAVKQQHHAHWVEKLQIQKRIYITINSEDRTLHGAMLLSFAHQLGLGFKGLPAQNAIYVNFSNMTTEEHNLFLGKSQIETNNHQIYRFYSNAFQGKQVDFNNEPGFQRKDENMVFYAIPLLTFNESYVK